MRKAREAALNQDDKHKAGGEDVEASDNLKTDAMGREHDVVLAGGAGGTESVKAVYKVVPAASLIPSHNAQTFARRDDYAHENERSYDEDGGERAKVELNAQNHLLLCAQFLDPNQGCFQLLS